MIEIVVAVVAALATVVVAWMETRRRRDARHTHEVLSEVRYHTSNDHDTNLRDDVDEVIATQREMTYLIKEVVIPELRSQGARQARTDERVNDITDALLN